MNYREFRVNFFLSVYFRRPLNLFRSVEHLRPHRDVHVLSFGGDGPEDTTVPLVEEILDCLPDDTIHRHHDSRLPVAFHRVQLSEVICLVDRFTCGHVPLLVQRILPAELSAEKVQEAERRGGERHR